MTRSLLNPHLLALGVLPDEPGVPETVAATRLVSARRFDLTFKHLYAKAYLLGCQSAYPRKQYKDSITQITQGSSKEEDGSKAGAAVFVDEFDSLLSSTRVFGLFPAHPVPVDRNYTPLDGAHRVATALALGTDVPVLRFSHVGPSYWSAIFTGMNIDRAAVEYCKLRPSARIMVLFSTELPQQPGVTVVHGKSFSMPSPIAQDNLITELYLGESWLGTSATGYRGAPPKARPCFARGHHVTVVVLDGEHADIVSLKEAIRQQHSVRDCVHTTDAQSDTVRVARVLFSENSVAFLSVPHRHMPRLEALLGEYLGQIGDADQDLLCVDGSATLARYGLREPADLDFLHAIAVPAAGRVSSHNEYSRLYPWHKDDVIFDPVNHFWSGGIKYATLAKVREAKDAIKDAKNEADLRLMEGL